MPLSFGIPVGLIVVLIGAVLFFISKNKKIAMIIIGVGTLIAIFTFILIMLAVNSPM